MDTARALLNGKQAAAVLPRAAAFTSKDTDSGKNLGVVCIRAHEGGLEAVATDNYRAIVEPLEAEDPDGADFASWRDLLLTAADVRWIAKTPGLGRTTVTVEQTPGGETVEISANAYGITLHGITLRPSGGDYPDVRRLMPPDPGPAAKQAFRACDLIAVARKAVQTSEEGAGAVVVLARDAAADRAAALSAGMETKFIVCSPSPRPMRIAFKAEYLEAAAKAAKAASSGHDTVTMHGTNGLADQTTRPWNIRPACKTSGQTQILMPIRLTGGPLPDRAGEEASKAAAAAAVGDRTR